MLKHLKGALGTKSKEILPQQEGTVAILFAFFLSLIMIPVLALAIDIGGGYLMSAEMQNAATAASIASAIEEGDKAEAEEYFAANLPVGQDSIDYDFASDVSVVVDKTDSSVTVTPTNFERPAFFAPAIQPTGTSIIKASSLSVAGMPTGTVLPTNFGFVLDKSGSMGPEFGLTKSPKPNGGMVSKAQAAAEAFEIIMDKVQAAKDPQDNYSVAGTSFDTDALPQLAFDFTNDFPKAVVDVYNIMANPYGATCGACGLKALRMFLPNAPDPTNRKLTVVWMTDGAQNQPTSCLNRTQYQWPNGPQPPLPTFNPPPGQCGQPQDDVPAYVAAAWECALIKQEYPEVDMWTIGFGDLSELGENPKLLDFCASKPEQHLHAQSGDDLGKIFEQIIKSALKARLRK